MNQILNSTPATLNRSTTLVFIDAVDDYQQLVDGVVSTAEVFVLDKKADGIEQISQVLQQRRDIDAVHIISHGAPGCLYLGNSQLSIDTFNSYTNQLQKWDVRNFVLYGCNVAAGDAGEEFIAKLHALTGAEIAASKTLTGNADKGGNWELEVILGEEKPNLAFQSSVMAAYEGVLTQTNNFSQPNQYLLDTVNKPNLNLTFSDQTTLSLTTTNAGNIGVLSNASFKSTNDIYAGFNSGEYRNYFLFDIASLAEKTVTSATVSFPDTGFTLTLDDSESYSLFDFNESSYQNGSLVGELKPIHDDLITGNKYSVSPYEFNDSNSFESFSVTLSAAAITDLNQAISSDDPLFGMGGAVTTLLGLNLEETPPANSAFTDLNLSNNSINENVALDSTIGIFTTTDPDAGDTFTYELVEGDGSNDNSAFTIVDDELKINASPDFETKSNYNIRVKTTDNGGLEFEKELTININDLEENTEEAPIDFSLDSTSIDENVATGSIIGNFTTTDPDKENIFTYSFVDGGADNNDFEIDGNQLKIKASPDFETKPNYSIRVKTIDNGGLEFEKELTININDLEENTEEAPIDFSLDSTSIDENVATGSIIGNFTTTDPDKENIFTYSFVDGGADNNDFEIDGNQLKIKASPDFETKSNYSIRVRSTDALEMTSDKSLVIDINDVNEVPTDLNLSNNNIDENVAAGTTVGDFTTIDPDANSTFTYTLIDGGADNSAFTIDGNQLKINASPDFETKSNYNIRVKTTDNGGLGFEKELTININDFNENDSTPPPIQPPVVDPAQQIIRTVTKDGNEMEVIDLRDKAAGETVMASYEISREADYNNNVYFYKVDSDLGNIGDLTPDENGYLEKVLDNIINPNAGLTTADGIKGETGSFNFMGGDIFGIAIVANGTLEQALSNINSVEGVYLSYMGAGASTDNGNFDHIRFNSTTTTFEFEDLPDGGDKDFNDIKIKFNF